MGFRVQMTQTFVAARGSVPTLINAVGVEWGVVLLVLNAVTAAVVRRSQKGLRYISPSDLDMLFQ
jgi:hypothetical protein